MNDDGSPRAAPIERDGTRTVDVMRRVLFDRFGLDSGPLTPERLLNDLGLDSLGFVEYVFELEKSLKIILPDVPRDIETVGALIAFVEAEVRKQASGAVAS